MRSKFSLPLVLLLFALPAAATTFATGSPRSTNNDDSCDIALLPAATLLLPYFEVDVNKPNGATTLFTIVNVTNVPQVAHVTLWTDYGYPVINFNVWLTGYDVQSLDLHDIIARGIIAPNLGTGGDVSPRGELSESENPLLDAARCDELPGVLPAVYVQRMKLAFTEGRVPPIGNVPGCTTVGGTHTNAVGYATIDVVRRCGVENPTSPDFYKNEILWENVFTGDFQQINRTDRAAESNPLVHIRAVPEGGTPAQHAAVPTQFGTNLSRTFYSRYQNGGTADNRQPLPSRFVARWIEGGPTSFQTSYKIWRENQTTSTTPCADYESLGGKTLVKEMLMFDEEENVSARADICCIQPIDNQPRLPSTSIVRANDEGVFPPGFSGPVGGWMYMNLDDGVTNGIARQGWVITTMRAEGMFSTDHDATALGNGCSPELGFTESYDPAGPPLGPTP